MESSPAETKKNKKRKPSVPTYAAAAAAVSGETKARAELQEAVSYFGQLAGNRDIYYINRTVSRASLSLAHSISSSFLQRFQKQQRLKRTRQRRKER